PPLATLFPYTTLFRSDLTHCSEQLVAQLFAHVFGASDADAVLGRERTFKFLHQRGSLVRDLAKFFQIFGAMEIQHRPDMQKAARGMAIIGSFKAQDRKSTRPNSS